MYWNEDGRPITDKTFVERLYDDLPQFFENEDQLREIWGDPITREKLMQGLSEAGYDHEKLEGMQALIDAKNSDVYDVLKYVAFASEIRSRKERVNLAKPVIGKLYDHKQQEFINLILKCYIEDGIDELAAEKCAV